MVLNVIHKPSLSLPFLADGGIIQRRNASGLRHAFVNRTLPAFVLFILVLKTLACCKNDFSIFFDCDGRARLFCLSSKAMLFGRVLNFVEFFVKGRIRLPK